MGNPGISFPLLGGKEWDVPRAVTVFGFPIYFYGIIIALGFAIAGFYVYRRRKRFGLSPDNATDMLIICVAAGIVGARLYYVVFNAENYFAPGRWLNIFRVRDGGLAIYGGVILSVAALIVYARLKKLKIAKLLDVAALAVMIGQIIGRWGNFFNREAFGGETALPWRMGLHYPNGTAVYVHPAFLYESLWNVLGFVLLHIYSAKKETNGEVFVMYAGWYGLGRFFIEGLRADSLMLGPLRVSQLVAGACVVAAIGFLAVKRIRNKPSAPSPGGADDINN